MHKDPIEAFGEQLHAMGYVTKNQQLIAQLYLLEQSTYRNTKAVSAIVMDGPPGTGKTFAAECFAKMHGATMVEFQFTRGVGREALLYDMNIPGIVAAQTGKWEGEFTALDALQPGLLPRALEASKKGRVVLLLDELDKARSETDAFLLQFLQSGCITDPHLGVIQGERKNLIVFITKNNERPISEPLMRRCRRIYMDWPDEETEWRMVRKLVIDQLMGQPIHGNVEGLCKTVTTIAGKVRAHSVMLKKVPSTPELASAVVDCLQVDKRFRGEVVWSWLVAYPEDQEQLKGLLTENAKSLQAILAQF